jgi:hypothetical protein
MILGPSPVHNPLILCLHRNIPFLFNDFHVGLPDIFISSLVLGFITIGLKSDFYYIGRVSYSYTDGSGC